VIFTSCPSAIRNSISRPTEKLPARIEGPQNVHVVLAYRNTLPQPERAV
jgi:hypothetical protein